MEEATALSRELTFLKCIARYSVLSGGFIGGWTRLCATSMSSVPAERKYQRVLSPILLAKPTWSRVGQPTNNLVDVVNLIHDILTSVCVCVRAAVEMQSRKLHESADT